MRPPIAGPITRERFICTEVSATAPVRSSRGRGSEGSRSARARPARSRFRWRRRSGRSRRCEGCDVHATSASASDSTPCRICKLTSNRRRSTRSASRPPIIDKNNSGPSWPKNSRPTKNPLWVSLQRVLAEDDVLHPRADVGRERPDVHDAKIAVPERGRSRTPLVRDVAVDEGVFDVLELGAPRRRQHARAPYRRRARRPDAIRRRLSVRRPAPCR